MLPLPTDVRASSVQLLLKSIVLSKFSIDLYASKERKAWPKVLQPLEWQTVAEIVAIIDCVNDIIFAVQTDRPGAHGEIIIRIATLRHRLKEEVYEVADLSTTEPWDSNAKYRNIPKKRMTTDPSKCIGGIDMMCGTSIELVKRLDSVLEHYYGNLSDDSYVQEIQKGFCCSPLLATMGQEELLLLSDDKELETEKFKSFYLPGIKDAIVEEIVDFTKDMNVHQYLGICSGSKASLVKKYDSDSDAGYADM